jgi:hypothetical protein
VITPILGALVIVIVVGIYALVFGINNIFLGLLMEKEKIVMKTQTLPRPSLLHNFFLEMN